MSGKGSFEFSQILGLPSSEPASKYRPSGDKQLLIISFEQMQPFFKKIARTSVFDRIPVFIFIEVFCFFFGVLRDSSYYIISAMHN